MADKTLTLMVGLPRSGKSTHARKFDCPVVDTDAIRLALHGQPYIPETEKLVWAFAHYMVKALFLSGHNHVVLDTTAIARKYRDEWKSDMWVRQYAYVDTPVAVCTTRAIDNDQPYLISVIKKMAEEYEPVEDDEVP